VSDHFAEMLSALSEAGAEFIVGGAHARAAHGIVRATGDLDIWVRPTASNAARVWQALLRFGAPLEQLSPDELAAEDLVLQIGVAPHRIDVLTSITGVTFDEAWPRRLEVPVAGLRVPVLDRELLVRNKTAIGRPRDLADVSELRAQAGGDSS
jgi:hypothetical protein